MRLDALERSLGALDGLVNDATGRGTAVAVIDSGWDRTLVDCRVGPGSTFRETIGHGIAVEPSCDEDQLGHGTMCTSLLLSAASDVYVHPLRVFISTLETSTRVVERALLWCATAGVRVVNLSLGTRDAESRDRLYRACAALAEAGIIIVAAAGGGAFPSIFDVVLSVGSGYGAGPLVEFFPGEPVEIVMRPANNSEHGIQPLPSSYATPKVTALVARMLERDPSLTLSGIRGVLRTLADQTR